MGLINLDIVPSCKDEHLPKYVLHDQMSELLMNLCYLLLFLAFTQDLKVIGVSHVSGLAPHFLPEYNLDEARAKLTSCMVTLMDMRAASSTAVKLTWRV